MADKRSYHKLPNDLSNFDDYKAFITAVFKQMTGEDSTESDAEWRAMHADYLKQRDEAHPPR